MVVCNEGNVDEKINLTKKMEQVEIKVRLALFTGVCLDRNSIPDSMYCYALCHGEDDGIPCSIEKNVVVNYFGAIVTTKLLDFGDKDYILVKYDDFGFTSERLCIAQFSGKMKNFRKREYLSAIVFIIC